jgi:hypothetical protein
MYMRDWIARLDDFLKLSGRDILTHAGRINHEKALEKAHQEYEKYRQEKLAAHTAFLRKKVASQILFQPFE